MNKIELIYNVWIYNNQIMRGYTLQFSSTWWSTEKENNTIKKWIERMTHSGDIYI
jgi:hypothetical protein